MNVIKFNLIRKCLKKFSLIELVAVLFISGIMLAVAIPAFKELTVGSGVEAASRTLMSQLRLTRQYAITHRTRAALLIPQLADVTGDYSEYGNVAVRIVDRVSLLAQPTISAPAPRHCGLEGVTPSC